MRIYKEEIFGPVLGVVRVEDAIDEALELDQRARVRQRHGDLHARRRHRARLRQRVQIGMVGVNVPIPVPVAFHSFGGWKASLFGDHHMHGPEGVRFYTRQKAITQRWPTGDSRRRRVHDADDEVAGANGR